MWLKLITSFITYFEVLLRVQPWGVLFFIVCVSSTMIDINSLWIQINNVVSCSPARRWGPSARWATCCSWSTPDMKSPSLPSRGWPRRACFKTEPRPPPSLPYRLSSNNPSEPITLRLVSHWICWNQSATQPRPLRVVTCTLVSPHPSACSGGPKSASSGLPVHVLHRPDLKSYSCDAFNLRLNVCFTRAIKTTWSLL